MIQTDAASKPNRRGGQWPVTASFGESGGDARLITARLAGARRFAIGRTPLQATGTLFFNRGHHVFELSRINLPVYLQ